MDGISGYPHGIFPKVVTAPPCKLTMSAFGRCKGARPWVYGGGLASNVTVEMCRIDLKNIISNNSSFLVVGNGSSKNQLNNKIVETRKSHAQFNRS